MRCKQSGFSLMEALLAIVVVTMAGMGIYTLFESGAQTEHIAEASDEAVEIANVYTDLASANLTAGQTPETIVSLLKNSGRLSTKYFAKVTSGRGPFQSGDWQIVSPFGALMFTEVSPYSFTVTFPLACDSTDPTSSSSTVGQFFSKVKDVYSCDAQGSKAYEDCTVSACDHNVSNTTIDLYFNMNY